METLTQAIERVQKKGYRDSFQVETEGLRALDADRVYLPEDLLVDEVVRFEGDSDPQEQAALYVLRARDGAIRGSLVSVYGPQTDPATAEMVRRLEDARRSPTA